jgi:hypothetical protein
MTLQNFESKGNARVSASVALMSPACSHHIIRVLSMLVWQFRSMAELVPEIVALRDQPSVLRASVRVVPSCPRSIAERNLALAESMAELVELISDLRALKSLHRAEVVEQARVVNGSVIPARHRLRIVERDIRLLWRSCA